MEHSGEQYEPVGYGTYILVWLSLLVLTSLTVAVAGMHLGPWSMLVAILIAGSKAALVFLFFMHLKYESPFLQLVVFIALFSIVIFIGFTFFDISFR